MTNIGERRNPASRPISHPAQFPDLPVSVVLDRIPVPVLAVEHAGHIVFVNEAFRELIGLEPEAEAPAHLSDVFPETEELGVNIAETFMTTVATRADSLWRMADASGDILQVRASKSILRRAEDTLALVALEDFTDQLWNDPKSAFR